MAELQFEDGLVEPVEGDERGRRADACLLQREDVPLLASPTMPSVVGANWAVDAGSVKSG